MEINPAYLDRFAKKRGNLRSDLIKLIAEKIGRPYAQIASLVKGWQDSMIQDAAYESEKNGAIGFWTYRKKTLT